MFWRVGGQDKVRSYGISRYLDARTGWRIEKYSKSDMQIKLNIIHLIYMPSGGAKILSTSLRKECKRRNVLNISYVISWPHSCISQRKDSSNDKEEDGLVYRESILLGLKVFMEIQKQVFTNSCCKSLAVLNLNTERNVELVTFVGSASSYIFLVVTIAI